MSRLIKSENKYNNKIFMSIIIILIIAIITLLVYILYLNRPYRNEIKQMIVLADDFFKKDKSSNYVTNKELNLNYDNCEDYSGVYNNDGKYEAYLFCNDYSSIDDSNDDKITLKGPNPVIIKSKDIYLENGYESNYNIEVTNNYRQKEGIYFVYYNIYNKKGKFIGKATRYIIVKDDEKTKNNILLNGEENIYLLKGEQYVEPGYSAYDDFGNDISNTVVVSGSVDITIPGVYTITYTADINGYKRMIKERNVNVLDIDIEIESSTNEPVLNNNMIKLSITGKDYKFVILPDGKEINANSIEYSVTENGLYKFQIFLNNRNIEREILIENIYKEIEASCKLSLNENKQVFVEVLSTGGYGLLNYSYLDKTNYSDYINSSSFVLTNKVNNTTVKIKDSIGNIKEIKCNNPNIKLDKLEIHFIKINTGRYDAILFKLGEKTLFVDGGLPEHYKQIDDYLKKIGVNSIDVIIGSHGHKNHIGPHASIIRNYNVKRAFYNEDIYNCFACDNDVYKDIINALSEKNVLPFHTKFGTEFYFDDVKFETIGPYEKKTTPNPYSSNYLITFGNVKMMITGDGVQQENVLKYIDNSKLDVDIFKWPHHGQHSLTNDFLNTVKPEYVIITSNTSRLSDRESRFLKNINSQVYEHYRHGHIALIIDRDGEITVKTNVDPKVYKLEQ